MPIITDNRTDRHANNRATLSHDEREQDMDSWDEHDFWDRGSEDADEADGE